MTGTPKLGKVLKVTAGSWTGKPYVYAEWYVCKKPVSKTLTSTKAIPCTEKISTGWSLKITKNLVGKYVSALVQAPNASTKQDDSWYYSLGHLTKSTAKISK